MHLKPHWPSTSETGQQEATSNKCIATSNKCLTSSNKKLLVMASNHGATGTDLPNGVQNRPVNRGPGTPVSASVFVSTQSRPNGTTEGVCTEFP